MSPRWPVRSLLLAIFSHRTLALVRWDIGLLGVRVRGALAGQRAKLRRFVASRDAPVLLNLGAGPRGVGDAHWVNVDGAPDRGVQFLLDFSRPQPFDDGVFDGVFCEHVLEHFTQADGERLAREVKRILKPGGVFRVIVPDAEFVLRSYFEAPDALAAARGGADGTAMEAVNAYFRQRYEHQFMYDWPTSFADAAARRVQRGDGAAAFATRPAARDCASTTRNTRARVSTSRRRRPAATRRRQADAEGAARGRGAGSRGGGELAAAHAGARTRPRR